MRYRLHASLLAAAMAACSLARGEATANAAPAASAPVVHHKDKHAAPGSPVTAGPFVVETRTMRYVPSSTDDPTEQLAQAWARGLIVMPFVVGGPPGAAARVNEALYLHTLRNPAPTEPGPTFTPPHEAAEDGVAYDGVNFSVLRGDARVLSIQFEFEQCGMHCSTFTQNDHFDATTGRPLRLEALLTPQGLAAVAKRRAAAGMAAFARELDALPPQPEATEDDDDDAPPPVVAPSPPPPVGDPFAPTIDDQRTFYSECHAQWEGHDVSSDRWLDIELSRGTLILDMPVCPAQRLVERTLVFAPPPVEMPVAELEPLLTDYGRAIVLGHGTAPPPESPIGQVLHGHVGTAAITLYLDDVRTSGSGAEVRGLYYYDRYRLPILIDGQLQSKDLVLDEDKDKGFALHVDGRRLTGTWHGGNKTLPVTLE